MGLTTPTWRRGTWPALAGGLFVVGLAVCLAYGRRGFHPLDDSIVFDGGWRTLHGQVPWRDYATPNAVVPSLVQAGFFAVLGTTWFAYCLHAAVLNGLFCVTVAAILRRLGAGPVVAGVLGLTSAVVYYTPLGVPFMEQEAFFFLALATLLLVTAPTAEGRGRTLAYAALPVLVLVAALCKQLPSAFFPPVALAYVVVVDPRPRQAVVTMAAASAAAAAVFLAVVVALGVPLGRLVQEVVVLPSYTGGGRGALATLSPLPTWGLVTPSIVVGLVLALGVRSELFRRWLASDTVRLGVVVGAGALFLLVAAAAKSANLRPWTASLVVALVVAAAATVVQRRVTPDRVAAGVGLLALGLLLVCVYFVHLTLNEQENGAAFVFLALGLALLAWRPALPAVAVAVVLVVALADAVWFADHFDATRAVDQQPFAAPTRAEQAALPGDLAFLQWDVPRFVHYGPGDLAAAASYLRHAPGRFVLFGDTSILYALSHQESESPVLWYHFDLTYPRHDPALLREIEGPLDRRIDAGVVQRVVFDGPLESEATVGDFPGLAERVRTRGCKQEHFGPITVVELSCP